MGITPVDPCQTRLVVGQRIRQLREAQGKSVEDIAAAIAETKDPRDIARKAESLRKLEEGSHLPSIKILLQIARVLGKRLGHLLDEYATVEPVIVRRGDLIEAGCFHGSNVDGTEQELTWYSLAENKADRHMEPWLIELEPRKEDAAALEGHEAEEFVFVLSGRIVVQHGNARYELEAGDSINYNGTLPHHLHAVGDENARIIAIFYGYMKNEPTVARGYPAHRVERASSIGYTLPDGNLAFYEAAQRTPERVQAFVIEAGEDSLPAVYYKHEGEEFHPVLSGRVSMSYGEGRNEKKYELSAGDSIYFDSLVPHRMQRVGDTVAKVLTIAYEPA